MQTDDITTHKDDNSEDNNSRLWADMLRSNAVNILKDPDKKAEVSVSIDKMITNTEFNGDFDGVIAAFGTFMYGISSRFGISPYTAATLGMEICNVLKAAERSQNNIKAEKTEEDQSAQPVSEEGIDDSLWD